MVLPLNPYITNEFCFYFQEPGFLLYKLTYQEFTALDMQVTAQWVYRPPCTSLHIWVQIYRPECRQPWWNQHEYTVCTNTDRIQPARLLLAEWDVLFFFHCIAGCRLSMFCVDSPAHGSIKSHSGNGERTWTRTAAQGWIQNWQIPINWGTQGRVGGDFC